MEQPFADTAVAPIRLAVALAELQEIAPAPAAVVDSSVRADAGTSGMAAEVKRLALAAPEPARLSRADLMVDHIVRAARQVVSAAGRAYARRLASEDEALAFPAPAPVVLEVDDRGSIERVGVIDEETVPCGGGREAAAVPVRGELRDRPGAVGNVGVVDRDVHRSGRAAGNGQRVMALSRSDGAERHRRAAAQDLDEPIVLVLRIER